MLKGRRILLIIGGGIAAYKSLELIRLLKTENADVRAILTKGGAEFITPLSVASLTGEKVYTDLFSLTDEVEMGHIRLSRDADLIVVVPATANLIAKFAGGIADDLATTTVLATNKPVIICPAMNVEMWAKPATKRNIKQLEKDGMMQVGPAAGDLACGEVGVGRLSEPADILKAISAFFLNRPQPLKGYRFLVTAGPTHEALDPVRYISNHSSGKQGYAIAEALADLGATTTLISGPTNLAPPNNVDYVSVRSATEMNDACHALLPVDGAILVAAVADWMPASEAPQKLKKGASNTLTMSFKKTPDILFNLANLKKNRPKLVIGFAAETEHLEKYAKEKLAKKKCDWIIANNVGKNTKTMGGDHNEVMVITRNETEKWETGSKRFVAEKLAQRIATNLGKKKK